MNEFLGLDTDTWIFILTAAMAVFAIISIILFCVTISQNKKMRKMKEKDVDANEILALAKTALEKIPTQLNPQQPIEVPGKFKEIEDKLGMLFQKGSSMSTDFLIKIGNIEYTQGNLHKAHFYISEALEQAKVEDNQQAIGACLGNIGLIYSDKGDLDAALKYMRQTLAIFEEIGMPHLVEQTNNNILTIEAKMADGKKE